MMMMKINKEEPQNVTKCNRVPIEATFAYYDRSLTLNIFTRVINIDENLILILDNHSWA